jgi:hypothetical protein
VRLGYRRALTAELEQRIATAISCRQLPTQDTTLSAAALVGGLVEAVIGPLAPRATTAYSREAVQSITLIALRAVGVADAHARGLVMQTAVPITDESGQRTEDGAQTPNATSTLAPSST